jgi:amino acid transporter
MSDAVPLGTQRRAGSVPIEIVRRQVRVIPLVGLIFFSVSGGAYGLEQSVADAGPGMAMLMLLVIPVIFSVPCALMAAELGAAIPLEGGYYYWVKFALGRFAGYTEGMWSWLTSWLDTALYPVLFVDYLVTWFPGLARGEHALYVYQSPFFGGLEISVDVHWLMAVAFIVPLAALNIRGAKVVGDTSLGFLAVVLAPFAILTAIGLWRLFTHGGIHPLTPFTSGGQSTSAAFGAGLGVIIWNYIGWDAVSTVAGEVERPQRTYPLALGLAIPLITLGYVLPMLAALSAPHALAGDLSQWTDGYFATVGGVLAGSWLKSLIILGAVVSQIGLFSSLLLSGSRVPAVMARDGYLPSGLTREHPRYGTPTRSIIVSCAIFAVFCLLDFSTLLDADVMLNLAALLLEFVALIVLRLRYPRMRRPFEVPGGIFGAVLITLPPVILTAWLLKSTWHDERDSFLIGAILLVFGALSYLPARWWFKRDRPDAAVDWTLVDFGSDALAEGVS